MFAIVPYVILYIKLLAIRKNLFHVKRTGRPSIDSSFLWDVYNPCFYLHKEAWKILIGSSVIILLDINGTKKGL